MITTRALPAGTSGPPCAAAATTLASDAAARLPDPTTFARHLVAAHGYLELGLPLEAWNELEATGPPAPVLCCHYREGRKRPGEADCWRRIPVK